MPRRVRKFVGVVGAVGVAVEGLAVEGAGDDGVGLRESPYLRVVVARAVVIEGGGGVPHLAGEFEAVRLAGGIVGGDLAEGQVVSCLVNRAGRVGDYARRAQVVRVVEVDGVFCRSAFPCLGLIGTEGGDGGGEEHIQVVSSQGPGGGLRFGV